MTTTRRDFLTSTLAASLAVETSRGFAANDTLQVGLIGVGGRCKHLLRSFPALPNVKITAVCDVTWVALVQALQRAGLTDTISIEHEDPNLTPEDGVLASLEGLRQALAAAPAPGA